MSVTFEPFTGPGSTPTRRRFWDDALDAVKASRKLPGINVKVDEYPSGSVISVPDSRAKTQGGTGACCYDDGTCAVVTEFDCTGGGGTWQGLDATCDPNPCALGVCCDGTDCSISIESDCPGAWFQDLSSCDPSPCVSECCCFSTPFEDGLGGYWTTESFPCDGSGPIFSGPTTIGTCYRTLTNTYGALCDPECDETGIVSCFSSGFSNGECDTFSSPECSPVCLHVFTATLSNPCDTGGFSPPP